jgi:hypothetical protein
MYYREVSSDEGCKISMKAGSIDFLDLSCVSRMTKTEVLAYTVSELFDFEFLSMVAKLAVL